MNDIQEKAIDNLRSGNLKLSSVVKDFSIMAANKAYEIASRTDDIRELNEATKVIEGVSKMVGLSPKESQLNVQINAINGFDFIEIDAEDIRQLTFDEIYEEDEEDE
jgi:hypothetical protein